MGQKTSILLSPLMSENTRTLWYPLLFPASFNCALCKEERGNKEEGRDAGFSGWQSSKTRGEGEQSIYSSRLASTALLALNFLCHFLCAFSFCRLVGSLIYSPPQARDTSKNVSALTGYLTMPGRVGLHYNYVLVPTFEKVTVLLKSKNFHMRNCKRSEEHTLKYQIV